MCGILGLICSNTRWHGGISAAFQSGLNSMAHRGPDGVGLAVVGPSSSSNTVAFGHQRLAIFDLSSLGKQPMVDSQGRVIVFNGEIFNWKELRAELERLGHSFRTQTDTEVILAAYDAWGPACVARFNGFWSFALYDPTTADSKTVLFLSRDRFGIKPLYLYQSEEIVAFGSEIRPLLVAVNEPALINLKTLAQQLVYEHQDDSEQTLYERVREIAPATNAFVSIDQLKISFEKYWQPEKFELKSRCDNDALEEFSYLLEDATRLRLRADVEVALTLSGGVDSSAIAAAIASTSGAPVRAFTSFFGDRSNIDETAYAKEVAKNYNFSHVLVTTDFTDLDEEEKELSKHLEVLYSSFSQLVNWAVIKAISASGIKVFLNGQGGDELFLGYERYYAPYLASSDLNWPQRVREFRLGSINSRLGAVELAAFILYFGAGWIRKRKYLALAKHYLAAPLVNVAKTANPYTLSRNMRMLTVQETCGAQLRRLLRFDDRISSAFGMEGRPVFLDHRMVEFAISLEGKHKIRDGWTKFIVRRYLQSKGLPNIAWRKYKLGFPAPNREWSQNLLNARRQNILQNKFLHSVLAPGIDFERLDYRSVFKVLALESASSQLNWHPV